jgi:tRNA-dihydrouridine synthase A
MISVAPMMDYTDLHCRYFLRLLSPSTRLYTEMVTAQAILKGDRDRLLGFNPVECPLALQLGGSEPDVLAEAATIATPYGYDEINLNIGCPSDRVQTGRFGACLMAEPARVADCIRALRQATPLPVTVKTRIGIDDHDDYGFLAGFVSTVAAAGCDYFVVHARKAILAGLSPKENRSVPPLKYDTVYRLKREFPKLTIVINGGIETFAAVSEHLGHVDGVMIGRKAYSDPFFLAELQARFMSPADGDEWRPPERSQVVRAMAEYAERQLGRGARLHHITRHMHGMYAGLPGARRWRRYISEHSTRPGAGPEVLLDSLSATGVSDKALDAEPSTLS